MDRKVRDLMHQGVLTCRPETTIQDAARLMVEHDVSALVVVDDEDRMSGVLSRTDLVKIRLLARNKEHWRQQPVSDIMIKTVASVLADDSLEHASEMMMNRHIHRVVVVEHSEMGTKPLGILSITDIVRDIAVEP